MADAPRVVWQGFEPDRSPLEIRVLVGTAFDHAWAEARTKDAEWRSSPDGALTRRAFAYALHQLPTWQGGDRG